MGSRGRHFVNAGVYDIVWAQVPFGKSQDVRPCVIIRNEPDDYITVLRVSSALSLYNPSVHFKLSSSWAEFAETGLSKESFCDDSKFFRIKMSSVKRRSGSINGEMRAAFDRWLGLA